MNEHDLCDSRKETPIQQAERVNATHYNEAKRIKKQKLSICVYTLKSVLSVVIRTLWKAGIPLALLVKYPINELAWSAKDEI